MQYVNGKRRPEPGRHIETVKTIETVEKTKIIEKEIVKELDVKAVADAVIEAISGKISNNSIQINDTSINKDKFKEFDASGSLEKMAKEMVVQRGNSESNFDDLGQVKKTKKDNDATDKTIDILSGLED